MRIPPPSAAGLARQLLANCTLLMIAAAALAQDATGDPSVAPPAIDTVSPLTVVELREACKRAKGSSIQQLASVKNYCKANLATILAQTNVPRVISFRCAIARTEADLTATPADPNDPCTSSGGTRSYSMSLASIAGFQSTFLVAATDVIMARAVDALKHDVMELLVVKVCSRKATGGITGASVTVEVDSLLLGTCSSLKDFASNDPAKRYQSPLPGLTAIRASFRADLTELPGRIQGELGAFRSTLDNSTIANSDIVYRNIVLAMTGLHFTRALVGGNTAGAALRTTADSLGLVWANDAAENNINSLPVLRALTAALGIASTLEGAWKDTVAITPTEAAARMDLVVRTTLVSCKDPSMKSWPDVMRDWFNNNGACGIREMEKVTRTVHQLVQAWGDLPTHAELKAATQEELARLVLKEVRQLGSIVVDVVAANTEARDHVRAAMPLLVTLPAYLEAQDYASLVRDLIRIDATLLPNSRLLPASVGAALTSAANVAFAADEDAVRDALESAVAPPNRYLAKRDEQRRLLWLNAYAGGVGGKEDIRGAGKEYEWAAGVYMPLGPELAFAPWASLLFQVVDLGQVMNYRLSGDADASRSPPGLTIETVFSPGVVLALRPGPFMKRPYALMIGGSYAPKLRDVKIGAAEFKRADALRFMLGLAVDVPILP